VRWCDPHAPSVTIRKRMLRACDPARQAVGGAERELVTAQCTRRKRRILLAGLDFRRK
jgi:hypothetical protein